ncbi:MAG: acetylglutamate kinase [Prevotellaceae bacterium]|jgi:acetylglutamate kinase|nr:acetylglutamate kinase [Prevotellaceae bacterium]
MNTLIVKIGGNIIDDPAALKRFLEDFTKLAGAKILVHGGGKLATDMLTKLHIPVNMHEGRRITDAETLKICTMVYAGWINKSIVAQLQALGCNAIGLSGADANMLRAHRRPPEPVDFGFVGDVSAEAVDVSFLAALFEQGLCPVLCAVTHDEQGTLLNTNADTIASTLSIALSKAGFTKQIICFEKDGVLSDINNPQSVIDEITEEDYALLKEEGAITEGMIPKLEQAFAAIRAGVGEVHIKHARNLLSGKGTVVRKNDHGSDEDISAGR